MAGDEGKTPLEEHEQARASDVAPDRADTEVVEETPEFALASSPGTALKGPPTKVPDIPAAQGARKRGATAARFAVRGVRAPLVGRDTELSSMREVLERAVDFCAPQLITLVGNQGTGKTRLVHELSSVLGDHVRVYTGRTQKDGGRYSTIRSLLSHRFGVSEGDTEDKTRANFMREVERAFGDRRVNEVLYFLGDFLGLRFPDSPFVRVLAENPEQHDEISRTVLRRFFEVDASRGPLVLVFDDLHWADGETLSLLRDLGESLGGAPVVLVACGRPDLSLRFSGWGGGETDHLRLELRNLDDASAAQMFRKLLNRCGEVPKDIVDDAVEMTGGNPHFLEQLVRLFLANGTVDATGPAWQLDADKAAETELPISVEEAIEARIAALSPRERDVLEKGSVFGSVFWVGAVVALARLEERDRLATDPACAPLSYDWTDENEPVRSRILSLIDELVDRDYLLRLPSEDSTVAGDCELVFKHNLERELVAGSVDGQKVALYYRRAAQWVESKLLPRSEDQFEFLAQLYERGGETARAAQCYLSGANKAYEQYAYEPAETLYRRALETLDEGDSVSRMHAHHNLGAIMNSLGQTEAAEREFIAMLDRAWLLDHSAKAGAAYSRLGRLYRRLGDYDRSLSHLVAAHALFGRSQDRRGVAAALDDMGGIHWLRGEYGKALDFHRRALGTRRALGDRRSVALSLHNIGRVLNDSGDFKAATRQFREALDVRRDIGDLPGVVQSLCALGGVQAADENFEGALAMFHEAYDLAKDIGEKLAESEVLSRLGECKSRMGQGVDAVSDLTRAIELAQELGDRFGLSGCYRRMAEVYLSVGKGEAARDCAESALRLAETLGARVAQGEALCVLGEVWAHAGQDAEADGYFKRAIQLLAEVKHQLDLAKVFRSYADFHERFGRADKAVQLRAHADEIFVRLHGAAKSEA